MALGEVLIGLYRFAEANALGVFAAAIVIPVVGSLAAWIGKGGRTDQDGRFIASILVGFGFTLVVLEVLAVVAAQALFDASVLDGNVLLLVAPIVCLAGGLLGVHTLFPLNELGSVRTAGDMALFLAGCAVIILIFSQFRGWGIIFWGGIGQLVIIAAIGYFVIRRLYRRAFGSRR